MCHPLPQYSSTHKNYGNKVKWFRFHSIKPSSQDDFLCVRECLAERRKWKVAWVSRRCNEQAHLLAKWAVRFGFVGFILLSIVSEHIRSCDMHL